MSRLPCPVCGHRFDPEAEAACSTCPLRRGCSMVCCPACGHVTVDVAQSRLARALGPLLRTRWRRRDGGPTLADIAPGGSTTVVGFCTGIPPERWAQLKAYGVTPGRPVVVVQHSDVTLIRIDHTELAIDAELAQAVLVEA